MGGAGYPQLMTSRQATFLLIPLLAPPYKVFLLPGLSLPGQADILSTVPLNCIHFPLS